MEHLSAFLVRLFEELLGREYFVGRVCLYLLINLLANVIGRENYRGKIELFVQVG